MIVDQVGDEWVRGRDGGNVTAHVLHGFEMMWKKGSKQTYPVRSKLGRAAVGSFGDEV